MYIITIKRSSIPDSKSDNPENILCKIKYPKKILECMLREIQMICECINCKNDATWRQLVGEKIIRICEGHHKILRLKVSNNINIETNKDVLNWLLNQPSNHHKVMKYGIYLIGTRQLGSVLLR